MKIRIIFTDNWYYFEKEIPSKEEIRHRNLAEIVYKHGGIEKWMNFKMKYGSYYPPTTIRFFKLNHTSAGIPKKDFDRQIKGIQNMITTFKSCLTERKE